MNGTNTWIVARLTVITRNFHLYVEDTQKTPVVRSLCHLTLLLDSNGQEGDKEHCAHHDSNIMLSCKDLQNPIFTGIGLSS